MLTTIIVMINKNNIIANIAWFADIIHECTNCAICNQSFGNRNFFLIDKKQHHPIRMLDHNYVKTDVLYNLYSYIIIVCNKCNKTLTKNYNNNTNIPAIMLKLNECKETYYLNTGIKDLVEDYLHE